MKLPSTCLLFFLGCGGQIDDSQLDGGGPQDAAADHRHPADASGLEGSALDGTTTDGAACPIPPDDPSPGATVENADGCTEGQNTLADPDDNCGGGSAAWEYVPAHDIDVTRLELNDTGGGVALFDSNCDRPGVKLFEGAVPSGGPRSWRGADVSPPVHLTGGHRYFIQQIVPASGSDVCSIAKSGVAQRQFNPPGFDGPDWGGPYIWLPWTAHVIGTCP